MTRQWIAALPWIAALLVSLGCASPLVVQPRSGIRLAFQDVDVLRINGHSGASLTIEDPATIARLAEIHARTRWDPVPITMPIDLIAIHGMEHGKERFKLIYSTGWLMDTKHGKIVRRGTLSADDRAWMETAIRSQLPAMPGIL